MNTSNQGRPKRAVLPRQPEGARLEKLPIRIFGIFESNTEEHRTEADEPSEL